MANCGSLLKTALVVMFLVAVVESQSIAEKLATCCKTVNRQEITEPITGYMVQKAKLPCVNAIIFQTESGLFCSQGTAPWVRRKIVEFERARTRTTRSTPSSTASLLSIITSTASPPPSSTLPPSSSPLPPSSSPLPSFPSTSQRPAGETSPDRDSEYSIITSTASRKD